MSTSEPDQADLSERRPSTDPLPAPGDAPRPKLDSQVDGLGIALLAAGPGSRFRSARPKLLHDLCGQPLLRYATGAAVALRPDRLVALTTGAPELDAALPLEATPMAQPDPDGSAAALRDALPAFDACTHVLAFVADEPFLDAPALAALLAEATEQPALLPGARDGAPAVLAVAGPTASLRDALEADAPAELEDLLDAPAFHQLPPFRRGGVDDRRDLAAAEREMRRCLLEHLMDAGVTVVDPAATWIHATVAVEQDAVIEPNCYLYGDTRVATGAVIGPGTTLRSAVVGERSRVEASVIEHSRLGADVQAGPYAHVRGGSDIGDGCYLGNYAEVKNSRLAPGVKMHHFSYLGDADVGEEANIAAGAITCNYDGVTKHRTTIGARAFIGCDTMLVAPVTIGEGASTGAGTVVTKDLAPGARAVGAPARLLDPNPSPQRD